MQNTSLIHYTCNTGHWRVSPRSEVEADSLELLKAYTKPGVYVMPVFDDLALEVKVCEHSAGFSVVTLRKPEVPILEAGLAWCSDSQRMVRERLTELNSRTGFAISPEKPQLPVPDTIPWLGIVLFRGFTLLGERIEAMGDFERCLAWAILDAHDDHNAS